MPKQFSKGAAHLLLVLQCFLYKIMESKSLVMDKEDFDTGFEYQYKFEDIIPNPFQSHNERSRVISRRWPKDGMIMFYSPYHHNPQEICYIKRAVEHLSVFSCIPIYLFKLNKRCGRQLNTLECVMEGHVDDDGIDTFSEMIQAGVSNDISAYNGYVVIVNKKGCSSPIGQVGTRQELKLNSGCFSSGGGPVIHEMIHTLGYFHEHTRLDRDEFIKINYTNIATGLVHNFYKVSAKLAKDFGPYDYLSIMHYPAGAAAIDPDYPTIKVKQEGAEIGQRSYLSFSDKVKIRSVTRCPGNTYEDHSIAIRNLPTRKFYEKTSVVARECLYVSTK